MEQNYVAVTLCIGQLTHTGVCEVQMTNWSLRTAVQFSWVL